MGCERRREMTIPQLSERKTHADDDDDFPTTALLAVAPAAYAQTAAPAAAPETAQQTQAPAIKKVEIVELSTLPAETQTKVTEATAKTTQADLQGLRASIDANAQAAAALKSKGIGSEAVIAALMSNDGTLMLVTKKS
jgi:hypothetical protein